MLTLDEEVQTALLNSQISERHARSLIGLDLEKQRELLHKIINEKLTVKGLDEEIMKMTGKLPEQETPQVQQQEIIPPVNTPTFAEQTINPQPNNTPVINQPTEIPQENINILFNKYNENSIDISILKKIFSGFNILGKLSFNPQYNLIINKNNINKLNIILKNEYLKINKNLIKINKKGEF